MKRILTLLLIVCLVTITGNIASAQGLEDFTNYPETANSYHDGTFIGLDGSTWSYFQCRGDSVITAPTPTLGKNRTPTSEITSGSIANGIGTLSFDFEQVFSSNVSLDVKVNGVLITTITTSAEQGVVKNTGPIAVNIPGTFTLDFIQNSTLAGQVSIDNVTWTAFGGGTPDPEPSNYPTAFTVSAAGQNVSTSWTDATGSQLPSGYLVKISSTDNITAPVDGTFSSDDVDLADGTGAKNVAQGTQSYAFTKGLQAGTTYFVKIFPYTNAGSLVDYKTDGTAPSGNAKTQFILHKQDFEAGLSPWTAFSVSGAEQWTTDTISNIFAKMTGYASGASFQNEDWLISPTLTLTAGSNPTLEFRTAKNYGTVADLFQLMISTDYSSGDPSTATWQDISSLAAFSAGGWTWTASGFISLSGHEGNNVHLAFKYSCGTDNVPTWEVDDIKVSYTSGVGMYEPEDNRITVSVSPNPATEGFRINSLPQGTHEYFIFNTAGKQVQTGKVSQNANFIPAFNLQPGLYLLKFSGNETLGRQSLRLIVR